MSQDSSTSNSARETLRDNAAAGPVGQAFLHADGLVQPAIEGPAEDLRKHPAGEIVGVRAGNARMTHPDLALHRTRPVHEVDVGARR